ncbi:NAD(P)/FAD-dependent oxidoreductase [Salarchaeum japonicum]|uniref:NAD(P)/FAD-dependent oxidoreductase n=1 Tax=Salarchaeum japonicum TaxID=555573 RepID=A0AAV3T1V6_9EURY|nr:NAD(P)/FAD-dependent oxidoreductase [Salarchaeum japonicum]
MNRDVVVVGGGPTGCSAGVFTARYGLDTVVFDRGNAALARAAFIENYPGFPAGIDTETLRDLLHDHAETAGADLVSDMVESVAEREDGFLVETQEGRRVETRYVVAAAWYDGGYLREMLGDEAFHEHEHDGETHEHFDPEYADPDGRVGVEGLYVAAPAGERNAQAIVAAGTGAHVARELIADHRANEGYPEGVREHYDWLRPDSEFAGDWGERERWREWYDDRTPDGADDDLREQYIDDAFATRRGPDEIAELRERAHDRLLEHIDDDRIRAYLDD